MMPREPAQRPYLRFCSHATVGITAPDIDVSVLLHVRVLFGRYFLSRSGRYFCSPFAFISSFGMKWRAADGML